MGGAHMKAHAVINLIFCLSGGLLFAASLVLASAKCPQEKLSGTAVLILILVYGALLGAVANDILILGGGK